MIALWDNNLGQESAVELLSRIIDSKRIPHAFLFIGKEGVGKHCVAVKFAKLLNLNPKKLDQDPVQKKIENLTEPFLKYVIPLPRGKGESTDDSATDKLPQDVIEELKSEIKNKIDNPYYRISIDKASNIKINSIRDIKKFISINYDDIPYRIILIEDAHLMSEEAQNALLKSLEEPPPGVIFILTTPFENRLLPTIKSRCWSINFKPLANDILVNILTEYFGIEKTLAKRVSYFSDGSVTEALQLLENDFEDVIDGVIDVLRYSLATKYHSAIKSINALLNNQPTDFIKKIILLISRWFSDAHKNRFKLDEYYFEDAKETFEKFNKKFNDADYIRILDKLDELAISVEKKVSLNMIATSIIFEISATVMR